jgi:hypothetical protein
VKSCAGTSLGSAAPSKPEAPALDAEGLEDEEESDEHPMRVAASMSVSNSTVASLDRAMARRAGMVARVGQRRSFRAL